MPGINQCEFTVCKIMDPRAKAIFPQQKVQKALIYVVDDLIYMLWFDSYNFSHTGQIFEMVMSTGLGAVNHVKDSKAQSTRCHDDFS
jgi:hypothetical protein